MHEIKNYQLINWTDGMKINKSHFIAQENALIRQLMAGVSSLVNDFNYGLLPVGTAGKQEIKLYLNIDNMQQVHLRIQRCRALTRGGQLIETGDNDALAGEQLAADIPQLSVPFKELKDRSDTYYVVLSVHPYERQPFGVADPGETPPRLPFVMPAYSLHLMPVQETTKNTLGLFQLPVGRVKVDEQKVILDQEYVPPCSRVSSHPALLEIHAELEKFMGQMELYALQITQKILQKKQQNEMAQIVQQLCENIIGYTTHEMAGIRLLYQQQAPVYMIMGVSGFARLIKNTLDLYLGNGKEELINYFTEWCDVSQGELEGSIVSLCNQQYNHLDINASIETVTVFTQHISHLFASLSRLDYIGKRKEAGIFVKEQVVSSQPETNTPKRRSFLAD